MPDEMTRYKAALALAEITLKEHATQLGLKSPRAIYFALEGRTAKGLRKKLIAFSDKTLSKYAKAAPRKKDMEVTMRRAA